ncbi:phosphoglycerate mutase, partial [Methylobacterium radiotolerans]
LSGHPPVQPAPDLREIDVGELSGLTVADIRQQYPQYLQDLSADSWGTRRPGGESMEDLFSRCGAAFHRIRALHPGHRVLVFTHGGVDLARAMQTAEMVTERPQRAPAGAARPGPARD